VAVEGLRRRHAPPTGVGLASSVNAKCAAVGAVRGRTSRKSHGIAGSARLASTDGAFRARWRASRRDAARIRRPDLTGVEAGGAIKNVLAMRPHRDGLSFGRTRATLIRAAAAATACLDHGRRPANADGPGGSGVWSPAASDLSRSHQVGLRWRAAGRLEILAALGRRRASARRARRARSRCITASMPIVEAVCRVLDEELTPGARPGTARTRTEVGNHERAGPKRGCPERAARRDDPKTRGPAWFAGWPPIITTS
jgi:hypothetical protein